MDYATKIRKNFIRQVATPAQEMCAYFYGSLSVIIVVCFIVGVI